MKADTTHSIILFTLAIAAVLSTAVETCDGREGDDYFNKNNASHPVILVEADIYVNRFRTIAKLRFLGDDLELLQGVEARQDGFYDEDEVEEATEDHIRYLQERVIFRDAQGEAFTPNLRSFMPIDFPLEGIQAGELINYQIELEWEFSYENPPDFITIEQNMGEENMLLPAELKILMKQAGSDVPYAHMMKPKQPETFSFNWDLPALTEAASEKEWDEWFEAQREKSMGLISYSSVYSFLYIEKFEVRHEVLIPLATVLTMMEMERNDPDFLEIEEQDAAKDAVVALVAQSTPLKIGGKKVQPDRIRVDYYGLGLADLAMQTEPKRISVSNGRVGLILSFDSKQPIDDVQLEWNLFNDIVLIVDSVIISEKLTERTQFAKYLEHNRYDWSDPERKLLPPIEQVTAQLGPATDVEETSSTVSLPLFSMIAIGLALLALIAKPIWKAWLVRLTISVGLLFSAWFLSPYQPIDIYEYASSQGAEGIEIPQHVAEDIFQQLHQNMFRAFEYRHDSDIYDALDKSVAGDLLRELYLQVIQSLRMKEQGGSIARIDEINLLNSSVEPLETPDQSMGFRCRSEWNLVGTVEHWGHVHQRVNQYEANFIVRRVNDAWKIIDLQMINEEEGRIKTTIRRF